MLFLCGGLAGSEAPASALGGVADGFDKPEEARMGVRYRAELAQRAVNLGRVGESLAVFDRAHRDSDHHGTLVHALIDLSGHETLVTDEYVARELEDAAKQLRLQ